MLINHVRLGNASEGQSPAATRGPERCSLSIRNKLCVEVHVGEVLLTCEQWQEGCGGHVGGERAQMVSAWSVLRCFFVTLSASLTPLPTTNSRVSVTQLSRCRTKYTLQHAHRGRGRSWDRSTVPAVSALTWHRETPHTPAPYSTKPSQILNTFTL